MAETPFSIAVPDESILLLQQKLALANLPDELDEAGWDYGVPLADVRRLVARWKDGYDWRKYEAQLNAELLQFTRDIDVDGFGRLNIHYVHQKSDVAEAIPLLFVHGWPGSFLEVRKILPLLVKSTAEYPAFHVVAYSLPGYGFSEAPKKKDFNLKQYSEVGNKLMLALGYNEYGEHQAHLWTVVSITDSTCRSLQVTQGGDWGHIITKYMAKIYGHKHSKAWHSNMPFGPPPHPIKTPMIFLSKLIFGYTPTEKANLELSTQFQKKGFGYAIEQSTMPQTLGYGLADSPIGLLAWIYEKLVTWTDDYPWEDDEVLTWISIYWFSRAGPAASLRIYYEVFQTANLFAERDESTIPKGHSYFPKEPLLPPRRWLKTPNLVFESQHDSGGHFAAHEKPNELVEDLRKMFGKGGRVFGVVPEKTGYAKDVQANL